MNNITVKYAMDPTEYSTVSEVTMPAWVVEKLVQKWNTYADLLHSKEMRELDGLTFKFIYD